MYAAVAIPIQNPAYPKYFLRLLIYALLRCENFYTHANKALHLKTLGFCALRRNIAQAKCKISTNFHPCFFAHLIAVVHLTYACLLRGQSIANIFA
jgi:hypothetical protein